MCCPCDGHTLVGVTVVNGHDHGAIWEDDILIDVGAPDGYADAELKAVARGHIVGNAYRNSLGVRNHYRGFRWAPGLGWTSLADVDIPVFGVNARGSAVGGIAELWPDGSNTPTSIPGEGFVAAINDSGVVAGECVPNPPGSATDFRACEWTSANGWAAIDQGTFDAVTGINNSNLGVGNLFEEGRSFAILFRP